MKNTKDKAIFVGIFGRRNYGKSSLINQLAGQELAIVSDTAGTTTDPVKKTVEVPGLGPVVFVDTAGIDDVGELGQKRNSKSYEAIKQIDLAIMLVARNTWGIPEDELLKQFNNYEVPVLLVHSLCDLEELKSDFVTACKARGLNVPVSLSAHQPESLQMLKTAIKATVPESAYRYKSLLGGLVNYGDIVLLITPIDIEAPEGRMILPQVQTIRDILDNDCVAIVLKEREVDAFLRKTGIKPNLAITDSQIFLKAAASIPKETPLTSFSIVLARQKGDFDNYIQGAPYIDKLVDGDRVLLLESCTHHVSCDDIGRVKIPRWISQYTGKKLEFDVVAGLAALQRPIEDYSLVIQCGGCVVTRKQLQNRLKDAVRKQVPVTNYGMAIAYVQGIFHRAVAPFVQQSESPDAYL